MKIAVVHDDFIQWGGADRQVKTLLDIFPQAHVFTSLIVPRDEFEFLSNHIVHTTFMQKLPFKKYLYKFYFFLYPIAIESMDFSQFEVVFTSSARFAHGVITKPETLHISYVNSPGRMFWESKNYTHKYLLFFLSPLLSFLRVWDFQAGQRADYVIANSQNVKDKIYKYYRRQSEVIYPYVDTSRFSISSKIDDYFLIVTRLERWKKLDYIIRACNREGVSLKIVGEGGDRKRLENMSGERVEFLGKVSDGELVEIYKNCKALIVPQEEDFGKVFLEAGACGKVVIAYGKGGAKEIIEEGVTGLCFGTQSEDSFLTVLGSFHQKQFSPVLIRKHSLIFDKIKFIEKIDNFVKEKI